MNSSIYVRNYVILIIILLAIFGLIAYQKSPIADHIDLAIITALGYSLLSFLHYYFNVLVQKRKNKMVLFNLSVSHMLLKLCFSGIILALYYTLRTPESNFFALAFIIVYIGFSIFEGIYSVKQVKG